MPAPKRRTPTENKLSGEDLSSRKKSARLMHRLRAFERGLGRNSNGKLKGGRRTNHRLANNQFFSPEALDGRTANAKAYKKMFKHICRDLGGRDRLTVIELETAKCLAGAFVVVNHLNALALTQMTGDEPLPVDFFTLHRRALSIVMNLYDKLARHRRARPSAQNSGRDQSRTRTEKPEDE